jgi:hypothetical protein
MRGRYYIKTLGAVNPATSTPAFRRWFGDSKVVDERGEPLVVYHGTTDMSFDAFDAASSGLIFFTDSPEVAGTYAEQYYAPSPTRPTWRGIIPAYLRIQNPLVMDGRRTRYDKLTVRNVRSDQQDSFIAKHYSKTANLDYPEQLGWFANRAYSLGYDGVIARDVMDSRNPTLDATPSTIYVVFSPKQIKSARGNVGTFDPDDPSFLRGLRRRRR